MANRPTAPVTPRRRLASVGWAAEQAGISRSVAYTWARTGLLPGCVEMGGRYYVRAAPFLRWLDGRDAESTDGDDAPGRSVVRADARGHTSPPERRA